ncbi:MAG: protein-methionine-sulfoxide reductase heme-binding subunit MsrQ [Rhodobacteraceae bacterium]|nr:protein-methionine-sulfoxide reductase heme-binding subunit MsrQ [Paracoccaceae bacterium]
MVDKLNKMMRRVPAWLIYIIGAAWAGWLFWLALTGQMGPEPINSLERAYGEVAIKLLVAVLAITPLRKYAGLNLLKFRRALGVTMFFYVLAHFCVWALLDVGSAARVWADIVKRPYVTVGMVAFLISLPLAVTSNNMSLRKLGGATWRKLHKLTYLIPPLAALHYIWLSKGFQIEPLVYLAIFALLLGLRFKPAAFGKLLSRQK